MAEAHGIPVGLDQLLHYQRAKIDRELEATCGRTQALRELTAEIERRDAIASQAIGVQMRDATRYLGDLVSGELGVRVKGTMPGSGQLASLGSTGTTRTMHWTITGDASKLDEPKPTLMQRIRAWLGL